MSRRLHISLLAACVGLASVAAPARALPLPPLPDIASLGAPELSDLIGGLDSGLLDDVLSDVTRLSANTAVWLAQHLPAAMPQTGMGSGLNLSEDFGIALGVIPLRLGVFNQFDEVAKDMKVLEIGDMLPAAMIWPQFGVSIGIGLGLGIEVAADLQFVPDMNVTLLDEVDVTVGVISASASARWRINDPWGPLPAFIVGVGGAYYAGTMKISAGQSDTFTIPMEFEILGQTFGSEVQGTYGFNMAPEVSWTLYQICPEVRLAWELGPFQPYLGLGLGLAFGEVVGGATVSAEISVETVDGGTFPHALEKVERTYENLSATEPAKYTLRPHVGFDIDLGLFALTAQIDVAIMAAGTDELKAVNPDVVNDITAKGAKTSVALVGTIAARVQF